MAEFSLFDKLRAEATGEELVAEGTPKQLDQRIPPEEWPWDYFTDGNPHTVKLSDLGVSRFATFKRYATLIAGQRDMQLEIGYDAKMYGDYVAFRYTPIDIPDFMRDLAVSRRQLTAGNGALPAEDESASRRRKITALPSRSDGDGTG